MKCGNCGEVLSVHDQHTCGTTSSVSVDELLCENDIDAEYYIYIFTFVYGGKQRYYVGETKKIRDRAQSHIRYKDKAIAEGGKIKSVPPEEIEPLSVEVVDTARTRDESRYKERNVFLNLASKLADNNMVCGGR